ncbi:MAG TPA: DNA-binding response regulator [Myxococcales bacterium]|nr:DNA-binding response regulator [Myxococcales bacterium]HAN32543.1 DNA-binding response regulator [Myxococcales bacterium]
MPRLLLVDDDVRLGQLLERLFEPEGFQIARVTDGIQGVRRAINEVYDLIILDVMLPGIDGFEVLRRIRSTSVVPVLMLTAKGTDNDRVVGLDLGADDYLPKPFNPRELVARVKAILRRTESRDPESTSGQSQLECNGILMDLGSREVKIADVATHLTTTEFDLLRCFMRHPGKTLSRDALMDMLRGVGYAAYDRSIDVHVKNLRAKIEENPRKPTRIKTVWGTGYMLAVETEG